MSSKQKVLIVDDNPNNIRLAADTLKEIEVSIIFATSGMKALEILHEDSIDLILMDINMPGMDGFETVEKIEDKTIPVIFVTAQNDKESVLRAFREGGVDYITKPFYPEELIARVTTHLALKNQKQELEKTVDIRTKELQESRLAIVRQLGRAAEYKDNETGLHVIRMSHYSRLIAESIEGQENHWTDLIFQASSMHDVGKIGIPDGILLKPDKLDDSEWEVMKQHPLYGAEIIGEHSSDLLVLAKEVALTHHEKYNGKGYPYGLKGEDIPISGRIVAVADVFDALTSERPYKKPWSVERATSLIEEESGEHFDPLVVEHFLKVLPQILEIKEKFKEEIQESSYGE